MILRINHLDQESFEMKLWYRFVQCTLEPMQETTSKSKIPTPQI